MNKESKVVLPPPSKVLEQNETLNSLVERNIGKSKKTSPDINQTIKKYLREEENLSPDDFLTILKGKLNLKYPLNLVLCGLILSLTGVSLMTKFEERKNRLTKLTRYLVKYV